MKLLEQHKLKKSISRFTLFEIRSNFTDINTITRTVAHGFVLNLHRFNDCKICIKYIERIFKKPLDYK